MILGGAVLKKLRNVGRCMEPGPKVKQPGGIGSVLGETDAKESCDASIARIDCGINRRKSMEREGR